jgi:hypothetical protein
MDKKIETYCEVILKQTEKHPLMEIRDIYKLIYQAAMGPGHAISNEQKAREWLETEINQLEPFEDESMIEEINEAKGLVRVNLRPYIKEKRNETELLHAFIETANSFKQDLNELKEIWKSAEYLSEKGLIRFKKAEMKDFFMTAEEGGFPAIHHSDSYRQAYKPAYRVVLKKLLTSI